MKCTECGEETKVIDGREVQNTGQFRRRRECLVCSFRFTTREAPDGADRINKLERALRLISRIAGTATRVN